MHRRITLPLHDRPRFGPFPAWRGVLLAVAGWLITVAPCFAVIIFEKGKSEPIRGYMVSSDAARVVVKELLPSGETRDRVLLRSEIGEMIQAVSAEQLAKLRREQPQGYRDYAEELAEKREDPDARLTALRLYLIAAHLDPKQFGRSSMLGMAALARSPDEDRKFRAMSFLLDPDHNRAILRGPLAVAQGSDPTRRESLDLKPAERAQLAQILKALRDWRPDDARSISQKAGGSEAMERAARWIRREDFATLRRGEPVAPPLLRRIVALELMLAGDLPPEDQATAIGWRDAWSQAGEPKVSAVAPRLTLNTITEFNPDHCHFRDGKWVP